MGKDFANQFGDFVLFGFSRNPVATLQNRLAHLGIAPQTVDFGTAGSLYFYTTYGDVVETDDLIGLKLGFARTPDMTPISTSDLLTQKLVSPQSMDQDEMRGSALVACLSKTAPEFSVYQTLLATPQLYYTTFNGDILCSSSQRCLISLLDRVELNEDVLPFHFLFLLAPGPMTYFQNVYRLFPGQCLHWREGRLTIDHVKALQFSDSGPQFKRVSPEAVNLVYERIEAVINAYLDDIASTDQEAANLLSGGVDSSVIQLVVNERQPASTRPRTYSYAVRVPGFGFEADYAREASQLFGTDHVTADIWPDRFPDILIQAIETVAQPIMSEPNACKMAMAEFLAAREDAPRFFLVGQGADAVYGTGLARQLAVFDIFRRIPASELVLKLLSALVQPCAARTADGLLAVAKSLSARDDPRALEHWLNRVCIYTNLEMVQRSFGDEELQKALEYRRSMEKQYLNSQDLSEQLHVIDLLTTGYESAVLGSQMFLACKKEQIYPYLDEDVMRIAFAFEPRVRFIKPGLGFIIPWNTKHLLKQILIQRSYATIARKRKGGSVFDRDLFVMMKSGPLRDMVRAIDRPGFLSKLDFELLLECPDYFLWSLLTFDIFQKRVLALQQRTM